MSECDKACNQTNSDLLAARALGFHVNAHSEPIYSDFLSGIVETKCQFFFAALLRTLLHFCLFLRFRLVTNFVFQTADLFGFALFDSLAARKLRQFLHPNRIAHGCPLTSLTEGHSARDLHEGIFKGENLQRYLRSLPSKLFSKVTDLRKSLRSSSSKAP